MFSKCVHDISQPDHTVSISPRINMALPDTRHGICVICHKPLTFIREQGTKNFVLKEVEE